MPTLQHMQGSFGLCSSERFRQCVHEFLQSSDMLLNRCAELKAFALALAPKIGTSQCAEGLTVQEVIQEVVRSPDRRERVWIGYNQFERDP
jgi:hypothetical protein